MEDKFWGYLTAFVLVSLFGLLVLTATTQVADNYGKDTAEIVGGALSLDDFNDSISGLQTRAEGWKKTFVSGSIWDIAGVVVTGIFGLAKDMIILILTPFSVITNIMVDVFNIPVWVTSTLIGLLIIGMILAIWRLVKIGD